MVNAYRVEKLLKAGCFGKVYLVTHVKLDLPYALKVLPIGTADAEEQARRRRQFDLEARILAQLSHPNLVKVHNYFEEGKFVCLAMDYVDGVDLGTYLGTPMAEPRVLGIAAAVLNCLEYLHQHRPPVILRDLKPDNIMMTEDGHLKLLDFGIAKILEAGRRTSTIAHNVGSRGFAPPEQYGSGGTDHRTDYYAFGATLLCLLCGSQPPESMERIIGEAEIERPQAISDHLWKALVCLMDLAPDNRPQSITEIRQLLRV